MGQPFMLERGAFHGRLLKELKPQSPTLDVKLPTSGLFGHVARIQFSLCAFGIPCDISVRHHSCWPKFVTRSRLQKSTCNGTSSYCHRPRGALCGLWHALSATGMHEFQSLRSGMLDKVTNRSRPFPPNSGTSRDRHYRGARRVALECLAAAAA